MNEMDDFIKLYIIESNGGEMNGGHLAWAYYRQHIREGWRKGQAFFNALPIYDQNRLRGTLLDPFWDDSKIEPALEWLVDNS